MSTNLPEAIDRDPQETREWIDSLESVIAAEGPERARYLLRRVLDRARLHRVEPKGPLVTDYVNTIPAEEEPEFPGDREMELRIRRIIRWNAVAMVHRANTKFSGIGGHLSSYASSATQYEVGFNHFFRGPEAEGGGDLVFFQGHAAPGIYSRSFLEGRFSIEAMERFRREVERGAGLSSYPHPRLMPTYWQFPTVSMGIGPISAIYQARFARYLQNRGFKNSDDQRVWCFIGDGECDEPETLGQLSIAAREKLDNLVFVVNCNLQRLDGPVRGNGKIIQELEGIFRGAGWEVIKVIWAPEWDPILAKDHEGVLRRHMNATVDGQWQRYTNAPGDYIRQHFFGTDPRMLEMVSHLSDEEISRLRRGGHSYRKVYAAFHRATSQLYGQGRPIAILCHTVKGWTLGEGFEGVNVTHQKKKMDLNELRAFRDKLELPVPDDKLEEAPFYHPGMDSPEVEYMLESRRRLGGVIPSRRTSAQVQLEFPNNKFYDEFDAGMAKGEASTTMVFSRLLAKMIRDKKIGRRVVPIIPDEARTFGLDALFGQVGIYAAQGQLYEPIDKGKLLYYKESKDGQVLQEGITEAGATASWTAAATAYSVHNQPMIPFYIFYSMFGFQRVGDQIWAAGDQMARGFMLGATAGRTTLNGEGLQHEDGHSLLNAMAFPSVKAYDPAFAFELATIIEDGMRRMYTDDENIFYYITVYNENYAMPPIPGHENWAQATGEQADPELTAQVKQGIIKGIYLYSRARERKEHHVQLLGSGPIMMRVLEARDLLAKYGVSADVWSVTSYQQLRYEALRCDRWNRLHPEAEPRQPFLTQVLQGADGPFIAASDFVKALPDLVREWIPGELTSLGTEGFGLSDTREALRRHFEIDKESIALAALDALRRQGQLDGKVLAQAIRELSVDPDKLDPLDV